MTLVPSTAAPRPFSALFVDDEPVLQSHPLLEGIPVALFGQTGEWLYDAHPRPANLPPSDWKSTLPPDPVWNLRVRELLMIMLNPEHPALLATGHRLAARRPCKIQTAVWLARRVNRLASRTLEQGLPRDLGLWDGDTARSFVEQYRDQLKPSSLHSYIDMVKKLHEMGPYLTGGGLSVDPWPGRSARKVAKLTSKTVVTENVDPDVWFALIRAAYVYVHDFAGDVLAARDHLRSLRANAVPSSIGLQRRLTEFLADPSNRVPVHVVDRPGRYALSAGTANLDLLWLQVGVDPSAVVPTDSLRAAIREQVDQAVAAGRTVVGGLGRSCTEVLRLDGGRGPWHPGMSPTDVSLELLQLRNACYVLVAGLTMMRDSEVREITRGSVVEHYGSPAVVSRRHKNDPNTPEMRWWIADPVAEAIAVAEAVSWHEELIFAGAKNGGWVGTGLQRETGTFDSRDAVLDFIAHVNQGAVRTGLAIPPGRATPRQFRKTMAMLTARRPGGEIAVHHQLKHVATRALANRVTEGYWAADKSWNKILDAALEEVRIEKLSDLYAEHRAGRPIGYGAAAEKLAKAFDAVAAEADRLRSTGKARHGDARVEFDLLRSARISIRFGTLNHCTVDDRNPIGAKCLEAGLTLPTGHTGPIQNLCQPGKCANSLIRPEHLPIRHAERSSLLAQMANPKLSEPQRGALQLQLDEVDEVIARAVV